MVKDKSEGLASIYMASRIALARAVRRIVRRHDVEDVLQEAFVRSFEAEGRHPIHDARAFLMRTAKNIALDHVTSAGYRTTGAMDGVDEEFFTDPSAPPDVCVDAQQRFLQFCEAVGSLPEQCRRVFVLKQVYGLSQEGVAARVGIAESTVEKHIAKGALLLYERMHAGAARTKATARRSA